jgi:cysteine-rich repeat protein
VAASGSIADDDAARLLGQSVISRTGVTTPASVARCTFATNDQGLSAQDFVVTVLAASTPGLESLSPTMAVTSVECAPAVEASDQCVVDFAVNNTTDVLTALQFNVTYGSAPAGGFVHDGCTLTPLGGLVDVNDDKAQEKLTVAYADNLSTFGGPGLFASCKYLSTSGVLPAPNDFTLTVDDASEGVPPVVATPQPTMSVSIGACTEVSPVCGNRVLEPGEGCDDGNLIDGDGCSSSCVSTLVLLW